MEISTRPAQLRDAAAIASIYNEGIVDRMAMFEIDVRTSASVETWFTSDRVIVVALASTSPYRSRLCNAGVIHNNHETNCGMSARNASSARVKELHLAAE